MSKHRHVTRRADGTWANIGAGNQRATSLHSTQGEAIQAAKPLAQQAGGASFLP